MNLLFHICCAPCANQPIRLLREEGVSVTGFWFNPNIHPYTEYQARKHTLETYAKEIGLKLLIGGTYDLRPFITHVADNIDGRCAYCYQVRMERTAQYAAEHGYKGIKLHPEYQNFEVGDEKMFPLYEYALDKGLIILFHAGYDPIGTAPYRSNPAAFRKVVRAMGGGVIVAAHFGGQSQWDDVEKYLVGENIYLDTSMGTEYYSEEQFLRIVRAHGADKVLFASDSPWSDAGKEIANIEAMPLSAEEKEAVFAGNAKKLLGIAE